ncbi:MAG TPA: type II secretion system protein, partial [Candidatus Stercorousia faecigallinarum]|nr:type II secretion system protein [Candidatus Stercorousia faecigallinarum]
MSGGGRFLASSHAFTLAEVLVTLGIIGVVSAMTVPSLMQNHQKKTYVTQLHKV